jgi:HEAT repeat protein
MAICDDYWNTFVAAAPPGVRTAWSLERYTRYVQALNELTQRGPEICDWCRRLLVHPDYNAREHGAFLLGQLGKRRLLGDAEASVVAELGALTQRPVEEDGKELQAVDAAICALADIGDPAGIPHLRAVLLSERLRGDSQWDAADALGRLVAQPFMESADPVGAARTWLETHTS